MPWSKQHWYYFSILSRTTFVAECKHVKFLEARMSATLQTLLHAFGTRFISIVLSSGFFLGSSVTGVRKVESHAIDLHLAIVHLDWEFPGFCLSGTPIGVACVYEYIFLAYTACIHDFVCRAPVRRCREPPPGVVATRNSETSLVLCLLFLLLLISSLTQDFFRPWQIHIQGHTSDVLCYTNTWPNARSTK